MREKSHYRLGAALAATVFGFACIVPAAYGAEVTESRLLNAADEPQNWLTVYGNYNSDMHSRLTEIDRENVGDMRFAFGVSLGGMTEGAGGAPQQEATPLVNDGFLYVNNAWNQVFKIDVRSGRRGEILWKYDPAVDPQYPPIITSRGITLSGNNVYIATIDARMVAVDADSGESLWEVSTQAAEAPQNQSHTGAPIAIKDMILVGQSNGFAGNRGWIGAFNAEDGSLAWRRFMVPGPGEPGHETWKDDHGAWQTGGAAVWTTGAYDPESEVTIWGTGDAAPWFDPEFRPGDNLFAVSTVALDVNTGDIAWYFQEIANESWDFDTVNPRMLFDIEVDGQTRKVSANFSRNGFYYTLDRTNGQFIHAGQWAAEVNWTAGIDEKTGKPVEYDPNVDLQDYIGNPTRRGKPSTNVCPNYAGAPTYFPPTYDPERMRAYIASSEGCVADITISEPLDEEKDWRGERLCCRTGGALGRQAGHITGVDVTTGEVVVTADQPYPLTSGLMSTAGDLIFVGHPDGKFAAYDSDTLDELWSVDTGMAITAPPISYAIDGKQYVAVVGGGPGLLRAGLNAPELVMIEPNSMLLVFSL